MQITSFSGTADALTDHVQRAEDDDHLAGAPVNFVAVTSGSADACAGCRRPPAAAGGFSSISRASLSRVGEELALGKVVVSLA